MVLTRSLETACAAWLLTILFLAFLVSEPEPAEPELAETQLAEPGAVNEPLEL